MFNVYNLYYIIVYMYVCMIYYVGIYISFPNSRHRHFLTKYCTFVVRSIRMMIVFFCPLKLCYYIPISDSKR